MAQTLGCFQGGFVLVSGVCVWGLVLFFLFFLSGDETFQESSSGKSLSSVKCLLLQAVLL